MICFLSSCRMRSMVRWCAFSSEGSATPSPEPYAEPLIAFRPRARVLRSKLPLEINSLIITLLCEECYDEQLPINLATDDAHKDPNGRMRRIREFRERMNRYALINRASCLIVSLLAGLLSATVWTVTARRLISFISGHSNLLSNRHFPLPLRHDPVRHSNGDESFRVYRSLHRHYACTPLRSTSRLQFTRR